MTVLLRNKKVGLKYEILDRYTGGIVLEGHEVKSLRDKQGSMEGSFVSFRNKKSGVNELWIRNLTIPAYQPKNVSDSYDPERERKILVKKEEIRAIERELNTAGVTLVPLSIDARGARIKLDFALVRGKKKFDKREDMKKKTAARDAAREAKARLR